MNDILYVLGISLQLAGAVLLLIKYCFTPSKRLLKDLDKKKAKYSEKSARVTMPENPTDKEFMYEIWLSRWAFIFIAAGYPIGVLGELESLCRCCATLLVITFAAVLVVVGLLLASIQSKKYNDSSAVVRN